jgi:hypothetical protein
MEFNGLLILAALWFFLNLINKLGRRSQGLPRSPEPRRPMDPRALPSALDATQREGNRLELVLREFQRELEEAEAADRPVRLQLPRDEEVEERETLEVEPEVKSLEGDVRRADRQRVDQDDQAEQIETQRIAAAAARDAPRSKSDHAEFDQRIRQEPADHTATRAYTPQQLRDAMVWREILGPPVSMRDER